MEFGKPPRAVLRIDIKEVYFHCGKALMRSKLWAGETGVERAVMPSIGEANPPPDRPRRAGKPEVVYARYKTHL